MRQALVKTLLEIAAGDRRVLLLTADLGYMVVEPFAEKYPDRFINVGVAEQNMIGVATGLAEAGFIPFAYSIAPFAAIRPYEFIRNGPALHRLPVRVVGVGGGFDYGHNGVSHHALEDIGLMRLQPGMTVIAPGDAAQTAAAARATWNLPGPVYYRLSKEGRKPVPGLEGRFELGRAQMLRSGRDLLLAALGDSAHEALAAADLLAAEGVEAAVMLVSCVSPAPTADLEAALRRFNKAVVVEGHYANGGLGSLAAEIAAERGLGCRVLRQGVKSGPDGRTGSKQFLQERHGISGGQVARAALQFLRAE